LKKIKFKSRKQYRAVPMVDRRYYQNKDSDIKIASIV